MEQALCDEALEQLAEWACSNDPDPPVHVCDVGVPNQHAACVIIARCYLMSKRQPRSHGVAGWCGMSMQFDCSPSQVAALVAAGAKDERSDLTRKIAALRAEHIEKNGSAPQLVQIAPRDERAWLAHGVPEQWQDRFTREGRGVVIRIFDMAIEWDAPTTTVR